MLGRSPIARQWRLLRDQLVYMAPGLGSPFDLLPQFENGIPALSAGGTFNIFPVHQCPWSESLSLVKLGSGKRVERSSNANTAPQPTCRTESFGAEPLGDG